MPSSAGLTACATCCLWNASNIIPAAGRFVKHPTEDIEAFRVESARCSVSRQIIVGDVALLRAGGVAVMATPRGYILENAASAPAYAERRIVAHHDEDRLREELYTIVDLGGAAIDVTVEHSIYGQITAPLHIFSRYDADAFCNKLEHSKARPLCDLTGGIHLHTVRAPDERTLDRVIAGLKEKGFLLEEEN